MRKRIFSSTIAAAGPLCCCWPCCRPRALYCIAKPARAHSPGGASLTALTVTAGGTAQTLTPAFSSTVYSYTVPVADTVTQITIEATPDGDGTVAYEDEAGTELPDADANTPGQQVTIPTVGKRINVEVTHTDSGVEMEETYGVLVIREGPAVPDTIALMDLYNSMDGPNWNNDTNWGSTKSLEAWEGVTTVNSAGNRVIQLDLSENNLVGTIPASLSNLDQMKYLYLADNKLTGPIPDLSSFTDLTSLALDYNQFTGEIPKELGERTSLQYLWLGSNDLSGEIPAELGNLTNLQTLSLWGNDLSGQLPDSLGNLTDLTTLDISGTNLDGQIPDLSRLTNLQLYLYLRDNQLSGPIPDWLSSLTYLEELDLSSNELTGTIPDLSLLTRLTTLNLGNNPVDRADPGLAGATHRPVAPAPKQ